ncbi:hypothetical protein GOP47_0012234 [Adiantum capillus-veneris]|uniref:DUF952 domain-containing protein n=1 Tax=Adiantum capillus-veneris TaxID=13818 RepID=A0A9D4ZE44_ADICA|nr:hypothetical protein GOP47_0012234 [Adiantum capillus-veneris]
MGEILYRISPLDEVEAFKHTGLLHGGELDRNSGFIHLSKASQVAFVLDNFLPGREGLYLLSIDASKLGDGLKYERVDGVMEQNAPDNHFPHFYGPAGELRPLPIEALVQVHKLELLEGKHLLPF